MRMGKYDEALGIWRHTVGEITNEVKPKKGDNLRISRILDESKKRNDNTAMIEALTNLYCEMVLRDKPIIDPKEKEDFLLWAEMNQMTVVMDMLIAFRWTTREQIDKTMADVMSPKKVASQMLGSS